MASSESYSVMTRLLCRVSKFGIKVNLFIQSAISFAVMEPVKIARLSEYHRSRIDRLTEIGLSPLEIRKSILAEENISITTRAIKCYIMRKNRGFLSGSGKETRRSRPEKRILQQVHLEFIDRTIEEDVETTAPELVKKLQAEFGLECSVTTVKNARAKLGWTATKTKYCQIIRDVNREKRLFYCIDVMMREERFENVIFTDECTVKTQSHVSLSFRRRGHHRRLQGAPKHPYQVHVWGGISCSGATQIYIFTGKMDSEVYQGILRKCLLPFIDRAYPNGHRLYQDNDPKHTSKSTKEWMANNGVTAMISPPESPDLNPIELVWGAMKYYIRRTVRPINKEQLVRAILIFWGRLTPEVCRRYISHLRKSVPAVVSAYGAATGH